MTAVTTRTPARDLGRGPARNPARGPMGRLVGTEARLYLREPASWFWSLVFPTLLLLLLGLLMPWADQPWGAGDLARFTMMTGYTPTVLTLATVTVAFNLFPVVIAGYRQRGVLRRLSTTPVAPSRLLAAQVLVQAAMLVVAAAVAVVAGAAVLGIAMPERPLLVVATFLLGALAAFGVGGLVAALAPSAGAATGIGTTLMFLGMFVGGVWLPLPVMPESLVRIAGFVPPGAATQAMTDAWLGQPVSPVHYLVLACWAVVTVPLAVRTFRWS